MNIPTLLNVPIEPQFFIYEYQRIKKKKSTCSTESKKREKKCYYFKRKKNRLKEN